MFDWVLNIPLHTFIVQSHRNYIHMKNSSYKISFFSQKKVEINKVAVRELLKIS